MNKNYVLMKVTEIKEDMIPFILEKTSTPEGLFIKILKSYFPEMPAEEFKKLKEKDEPTSPRKIKKV